MYTLATYNGVEGLESLCGKENRRTKATNMLNQMPNDMKLGLVEPPRRPACSAVKEIVDGTL